MLSEKVHLLKTTSEVGIKIANFWNTQIERHGEECAEAFYKSIGLNHLPVKSVEWEGLQLSREPTEAEKLCLKSISFAQDAGKASVLPILLNARSALIDDAIEAIKKLKPATYHKLILTVPDQYQEQLRVEVSSIFMRGKKLVDQELSRGKSVKQSDPTDEDDSELDDLADLTSSRVANDVQARITAATARFALLGLTGKALWDAVRSEIDSGSVAYVERASTGVANKALSFGRAREAEDRSDEWDRVEYSAILDQNVCEPCAADDGQTSTNVDDLTPAPNPDCAGGDWCRCFWVFIAEPSITGRG